MEKEKHTYTEDELTQARAWVLEREEFKETKELPTTTHWTSYFGVSISLGLVLEFACFLPLLVIWLWGNCYSSTFFKQFSLDNKLLSEGYTMFLPISLLIVFFAIIGFTSVLVWVSFFFGGEDRSKEEWMAEEIEKSEKMCGAAVQEAEKPLRAEILNLQSQLGQKQVAYDLLAKQSAKLQSQMKNNNDTFKREKKLWALEKKELQYQIKLKQGLVDEMDDADSPLGGLYN